MLEMVIVLLDAHQYPKGRNWSPYFLKHLARKVNNVVKESPQEDPITYWNHKMEGQNLVSCLVAWAAEDHLKYLNYLPFCANSEQDIATLDILSSRSTVFDKVLTVTIV